MFLQTIKKRLLNKYSIIFICILIIFVFSRFYKLYEFFTFNFDEEYQALLAWEQVKNFHPIWIGVSASNVNYYLGPGITYLNAFLFYITKDPVILGVFGSIFGLVTAFSIYFVSSHLFSIKAALFAFSFYTGSLFFNIFDRRFWNPTPIIFLSVWLIFSLYKVQKNTLWLIVIFLLMGISLHVHLSLLAFWPIIIFVIITNIKKISHITYLFSFFSFLCVTFPLLIFDLNHNFDNLTMPLRYIRLIFSFAPDGSGNFWYGLNQLLNTFSRIWYMHPFTDIQNEIQLGVHGTITQTVFPISIFSLIIIVWFLFKSIPITKSFRFTNNNYLILGLSLFCFIIVYLFYPGGVVAYFLLGGLGLFTIISGIFFSKIPKFVAIPIMMLFLFINLYSLFTLQQEQFGLLTRKKLIQKIMPVVGNKSFYLETRSTDGRKYHSMGGWRYLFKAYGKTPNQSHADDFFGWIYPDEISKDKPKLRVIVSEYPTKVKEPILFQVKNGVYEGYVVKNQ